MTKANNLPTWPISTPRVPPGAALTVFGAANEFSKTTSVDDMESGESSDLLTLDDFDFSTAVSDGVGTWGRI
jgi:hypothetical protein